MKRVILALAALLLAGGAFGQGVMDGKWWKRPRIAEALRLTPEQDEALEKIFTRTKPRLIDLRADLEKKQFDYDQAMEAEDVDRKAIEAKIEAREQARAALQKELALMELDMKQVLEPGQRERLARMRDRARAMAQERRRGMRDRAPDGGGTDATPPPRRSRRTPAGD